MRISRSANRLGWRLCGLCGLCPLLLCLFLPAPGGAAQARAQTASVAWLREGKVEVRALEQSDTAGGGRTGATPGADSKVPLGSLWKLFVFAYLAETRAQEPAYVCAATPAHASGPRPGPNDDLYCCEPGARVERDLALARSCAPYFSAARLGLDQPQGRAQWQAHWRAHGGAAAWILDIQRLQAQTEVPLGELLGALAHMPPLARAQARGALLRTGVEGYGREAWTRLGTGIRYKTYSWHDPAGVALGGAAGWLADGTPFWFGARGSSRSALTAWATRLAATLPAPRLRHAESGGDDASCVDIDFFSRYPLRAVFQDNASQAAASGSLKGPYRLQFANGKQLDINAQGNMRLLRQDGAAPLISGRFGINDYVARVIDREGSAASVQAARALAIAARSYLVQNAHFEGGCRRIADASHTQRVSPNPPSDGALAAAWFTDQMILQGVAVQYHQELAGKNRLAWRDAVARAAQDWDFARILAASYPQAHFGTLDWHSECTRLDAAETWLASASAKWQARLRAEPGFEALEQTPKICALADGNPYSDQRRLRIYVRGWRNLNERVTLAHEYLHLALRFHPNGNDEGYVERLARRLIDG